MHQPGTGHGAAVPPADSPAATRRPLPRLPREPRPPAASPAQRVPESTLPRPPGDPGSPEHYVDAERPLRPPPPAPYYSADPSYSYGQQRRRRGSRASSALASCLAATAFLLLAAGGAGAALFLLFRPRPPDIAVAAVRLPAFAAANGTVAFTFEQTAVVRNPNRSPLAHFDSSLRVAYAGVGELGHAYIPAGLIDGGRAKDMSASFDVPAFFFPGAAAAAAVPQPQQQMMAAATAAAPPPVMAMEVESLLVVKGRVTMLRVLTHRVQAAKVCRVAVSPVDGRVLAFRC